MLARAKKFNQKGYTLIELAVATAVMAVLATTVVIANQFVNKQGVQNADRTFATEKAIQMYEELRTLVSGNESLGAGVLDDYNNYSFYDYVLTTDLNVDTGTNGGPAGNPSDPLSGNIKSDGNWRYMRQVEIGPVANDTQARQVTVKVYLYPGDYRNQAKPGALLATVGGILRTSAQPNVPTQVLDIYVLQINTIPSWWSVLPTLAGYMQAAVADLRSRLNGYQIRVHYVTRTSYGRDSQYQPESNSYTNKAESTHQQWVYFYPGACPTDSGTDGFYFDSQTSGDPNSVLMTGNFMVDGTSYPVSTSQFNNQEVVNYSVADQYNSAMRYPDEMAAYKAVTTAAAVENANGVTLAEGLTEISERMLFENMLSEPASFNNSIIINLHGELLPLPPLRNYSDAAKDPGNQLGNAAGQTVCPITVVANGSTVVGDTNVRVVTHPELMYYPAAVTTASAVTVRLRVYAYYDSEDIGGSANLPVSDPRVPGISLFFPDAAVTLVGVTAEIGNSLTGAKGVTYARVALASPYSGLAVPNDVTALNAAGPMSISASYVGGGKQTLITLYNTPLRCPTGPVSGGTAPATFGGLNNGDLLYGEEYIPCSPDIIISGTPVSNITNLTSNYSSNTYTFTNEDLASPDNNLPGNPCNTARWIISVAMPITQVYSGGLTMFNQTSTSAVTVAGMHTIETYLGTGVTTVPSYVSGGVTTTITPDLSRTYVWCGDYTMPPYTEQYQFTGDPRDCPYLDIKVGGVSMANAAVTIAPNSYNWWFKGSNTAGMASDGYFGFAQAGGNSFNFSGNGNTGYVNVDLPRFYQLIRQGLLKTTSIWAGTNGWSWYYYGLGGEYGSNQGPRSNGIQMMNDVYDKTSGGAAGYYDNLSVWNGGTFTGQIVAANITGSNSVTWYQRSWLGEIYPDKSYLGAWVTYGNLPSVANTAIAAGSKPDTFYLEPTSNVNYTDVVGGGGKTDDGFEGDSILPNPGGNGSESFYDGKNTVSTKTFEHTSSSAETFTGNELTLAVTTYNIYPFPLPSVLGFDRPWDFNGGIPPDAGIAPYNSGAMTTTLDIPTVTNANGSGGVTSRLFYDYNQNGGVSPYAAGVVRMTQVNGGTTQVGYVIENGSLPTTEIGPQTLAESALIFGMRTFLDGGRMAVTQAAGHIVQLPLVKIFLAQAVPQYNASDAISFTVACPVTATSLGGGAVSVGMPVTDIWWAYNPNGLASYYTEEYPQAGLANGAGMTMQTGNYQEAATVVYNYKYTNNGTTWYYVQDSAAAVTGVCDCNLSGAHAVTLTTPWTPIGYNWPVATGGSGGTILTQGTYQLMVEAYRYGYGQHYSYDIQNLLVSW